MFSSLFIIFFLHLPTHYNCATVPEIKEEPRGILQIWINYGTGCSSPPGFPSTIPLKREVFKDPLRKLPNKWLWKVLPKNPAQLVILTNWAYLNGYNLQSMDLLTESPMSSSIWTTRLTRDTNCTQTLLVDGTKSLVKMKMAGKSLVTVETGVKITKLLEFLEENGVGLPIVIPDQTVQTVGQALSVGAYGLGVNSYREKPSPFASVSSLVMSFKTIVWDRPQEVYVLKRMDRPDPRSFAFLTNLGRSYLTQVTLLVQPSHQLRCQTFSEFATENLFASPKSTFSLLEESFAYLVEEFGKMEVTYFPYVDRSFVKVWTKEKKRPLGSLKVNKKYLSGGSSPITNIANVLGTKLSSFMPSFSSSVSRFLFDMGVFRMRLSGANDIWGTSHDTLFTFTNDTDTYNSKGYVVLTSRSEIQQVVHEFYEEFALLRDQFMSQGKYPNIRPLKIRVSGLDSSPDYVKENVNSVHLVPPALSVLAPVASHPEFDVAIIFEMEFLPGDSTGDDFIRELEPWIYANYQIIRPLWSTEWTHESGSFKGHEGDFKQLIRHSYGAAWNKAIRVLDFYDPHGVFSNPFFSSLAKT